MLDEVFQVEQFSAAETARRAGDGFFVVNGGCAANAAVAIARLGGRARSPARWADPRARTPTATACWLRSRAKRSIARVCQRIDGLSTALSAIFIDARGDRMIVTYRDERLVATTPADPARLVASADAVLADNRYPAFVEPICAAARRRNLPVILDGDRPTDEDDPLFRIATHVIFSSECLRATTGLADLGAALERIARKTDAFLAVTNGPQDMLWLEGGNASRSPGVRQSRRWTRSAPATRSTARSRWRWPKAATWSRRCASRRRPASNAARLGGSLGAPTRAEVEALLAVRSPRQARKRAPAGYRPEFLRVRSGRFG